MTSSTIIRSGRAAHAGAAAEMPAARFLLMSATLADRVLRARAGAADGAPAVTSERGRPVPLEFSIRTAIDRTVGLCWPEACAGVLVTFTSGRRRRRRTYEPRRVSREEKAGLTAALEQAAVQQPYGGK